MYLPYECTGVYATIFMQPPSQLQLASCSYRGVVLGIQAVFGIHGRRRTAVAVRPRLSPWREGPALRREGLRQGKPQSAET